MASFERKSYSLKADPSACADHQNCTHRVKLSLLISLPKVALGMPLVTAFIRPTHIRYQGLGVPHLDFEGSNECVLGLDNEMAGVAEVLETNRELHLCLSLVLTASYVFGAVRVATFTLLTLTALSACRSCGVVSAKVSGHAVTLRSSPTVLADTSISGSTSTRILSGKLPSAS
jgi:hypothetical protein